MIHYMFVIAEGAIVFNEVRIFEEINHLTGGTSTRCQHVKKKIVTLNNEENYLLMKYVPHYTNINMFII